MELTPAGEVSWPALRLLETGEIDLGPVRTPLTLPPGVVSEHLATEELGVLVVDNGFVTGTVLHADGGHRLV
ncbi:hypothetical protein [Kribbella sp. NPDC048915]|uniref:hypothetical protein n=1 Tax=Kribbella sp. NPDC048915 TaxID=3155148 RepID=UPI00340C462F